MPTKLHADIRWFEQEIALCDKAILEVGSGAFYGPSREQALEALRQTRAAHQEALKAVREQLSRET